MTSRKYNVLVMMSTYNGEKYLEKQLDSIINQNGVNVLLRIRDDGSKDSTISILELYSQKYDTISYEIGKNNLGPGNSFMNLLYGSQEYDFYAFSDQDDIWLPNKLIRAINMIEGEAQPVLYGSNQKLFFTDHSSRPRYHTTPSVSLIDVLFANHISGCTMVMNKALRDIIISPEHRPTETFAKTRMHDTWFLLVALITGKFVYDPEAFIEYRIHENNFVGISLDKKIQYKKNVFKHLYRLFFARSNNYVHLTAVEMKRSFPEMMFDGYITDIANYRKDIRCKMRLLNNKNVFDHSNMSKRSYFENIMFGKL